MWGGGYRRGGKGAAAAPSKGGAPVPAASAVEGGDGQPVTPEWRADSFAAEVAQAKLAAEETKDYSKLKTLLAVVAKHNYANRGRWLIPRTIPVSSAECAKFEWRPRKGQKHETEISISSWTTAEALLHFAKDPRKVVCGLNFANGEVPGGGYMQGAVAQEEELCRQMPTLYTSLLNASKSDGLYPYGPCTCRDPRSPGKYSDVLYTMNVTIAREGMENGYAVLPREEWTNVSLVAAAAPNIRFKKEVSDRDLMYETIKSIFKAPVMVQEDVTTLVLGAWGCGAFGGNPIEVADLFVQALISENLGQPYEQIHFAIPNLAKTDENGAKFRQVFAKYPITLRDFDLEHR